MVLRPKMFTATPPSTFRRRPANRRSGGDEDLRAMPYIPTRSSYSYGSPHSNMPKAPQLADTKVPMAIAMQQKQDAADARMKAEEREREMLVGEQPSARQDEDEVESVMSDTSSDAATPRSSELMPPPPPLMNGRHQSEVSDRSSIGIDTTLGFNRSYDSENDFVPVIGQKVTENLASQQTYVSSESDSYDDERRGQGRSATGRVAVVNAVIDSTREDGNGGRVPGPDEAKSKAEREAERTRLKREAQIAKEKRDTERRLQDSNSAAKRKSTEIKGGAGGRGRGGGGGGGGLGPGGPGGPEGPGWPGRSGVAPVDDADSFSMIGFLLYQWNRWLGASLCRAIKTLLCCTIGLLIIYHIFTSNTIKFGWRKPNPDFIYIPPADAPRDMNELIERVHTVEKELGNLGQFASSFEARYREVLEDEVGVLRNSLESAAFSSAASQNELRVEIASLSRTLETVKQLQEAMQDGAKKKLDKLYEAQRGLDKELAEFKALQKVRNDAMKAFEEALPKQMVATLKPNGKVQLTDEFQKSLQDVFAEIFPRQFEDAIANTRPTGLDKIPSWEAFLQGNEHKLRELIEQHVPGRSAEEGGGTPGGVVLSKGTVMRMVEEEAEKYHKKWEKESFLPDVQSRFASQLEELQSQIRKENAEHFSSASSSILAAASAVASDVGSHAAKKIATLSKSPERPLDRISQGTKELWATLPDYASRLIGATILHYVTSPSYDWTQGKGFMQRHFGRGPRGPPPPALAITPSTEVGECWPFPERSGDIGIKLAEPIYVSHVTIDHVSKDQAPDISSAPKSIEFWVNVPDAEAKEDLERIVAKPPGQWYKDDDKPREPSSEWVRVHEFMYNIHLTGSPVQTFQLPIDMTRHNTTSQIVAFRILDNWGHSSYTCLYRVRVHGYPPGRIAAMGEG